MKSKLLRLAEEHPDEVKIMAENDDGSIFAHIPVRYIKISPPKKMSDEQREAASERFKQMWKDKQEKGVRLEEAEGVVVDCIKDGMKTIKE